MSKSKIAVRIVLTFISFLLVFAVVQNIMVPKHIKASTLSVEGFEKLKDNSVNALFLGASQMFCTINAEILFEEYGICAYDLGASSQMLPVTKYYLEYALKTQKPDRVFVEMSSVFSDESDITDEMMSWSYAPMKADRLKWESVYELTGQNKAKTLGYCVFPLFVYHSRWNSLGPQDLQYYFSKRDYSGRGFVSLDGVYETSFLYNDKSLDKTKPVPEINVKALKEISELCEKNGISLTLFKSPVPSWTVGNFKSVQAVADKLGIEFLDLNNYLEQIGLDAKTDCANLNHLNINGAVKVTRYFAEEIF